MVGRELLEGRITDTNSQWLAGRLLVEGLPVVAVEKCGDDRRAIGTALRRLLQTADLVITSGGLGPTFDDLTFAGVAKGLGRPLRLNREAAGWLDEWISALQAKGRTFPPAMRRVQRRQAMLPEGAVPLRNERGSAPGLWLVSAGRVVVSLPGVPHEMQGLFENEALPRLRPRITGAVASRHYRFAPFFESRIEAAIGGPLKALHRKKGCSATVLARPGDCSLILTVRDAGRRAAEARLTRIARPLLAALPAAPYADDGDPPEAVAQRLLEKAGATLALAESITGGLIAERLTRRPGASGWLAGGMVCYQDAVKRKLGVPAVVLQRHGAVSAAAARAMALAARRGFSTDYALSATGYAGPGGGDTRHPVGTCFVALAGPRGRTVVESFQSAGVRQQVREQAATHAMMLLINELKRPRRARG